MYIDLGKNKVVLNAFSNVIEINPQYADAYNHKVNVLKDYGRKQEAQTNYAKKLQRLIKKDYLIWEEQKKDKTIEINGLYAKSYQNGVLYQIFCQGKKRRLLISKVIDIYSQDVNAYNQGNILKALG